MTIRVLIADDHAVLRAGLRLLLDAQDDMDVVGEAADGAEALKLTREKRPHVVLLDLAMPGQGGPATISAMRQASPDTRVLVLTMHDDPAYVRAVLDAGAAGYVVKTSADTDLLRAIRRVHGGGVFVDKIFGEELAAPAPKRTTHRSNRGDAWEAMKPLSGREQEVLQLLAHGHTNQEVADRLELSVKSVETYRSRLMEKLGLRSRAEMIRYALDHGFLKPRKALSLK